MCIPYTYLIGWPEHNKWYYGVRYSSKCFPEDLWNPYKTSSRHVKVFVEQFGDPAIIEIRKIFNNIENAREWEHKVLRRLNVVKNDMWLNKTHNKSRPSLFGDDNPSKRPEIRQLISDRTPRKYGKNNPMNNPITRDKVSAKLTGRRNYWQEGDKNMSKRPEVRAKLSRPGSLNPFFRHTHSDKIKQETGNRFRGIPKELVTCPHCNKIGGKNTMGRWHFNNCRISRSC